MIHYVQASSMPSFGVLSGGQYATQVNGQYQSQVLDLLNSGSGSSYFGSTADRYRDVYANTMRQHVATVWQANEQIYAAAGALANTDEIRPLTTPEAISAPPPCMVKAVLSYPPLNDLWRNGYVQGYGDLTPEECVNDREYYTREILRNGIVHTDDDATGKALITDDALHFEYEWHDDDPYLTHKQKEDIRETWRYIQKILDDTDMDPTDITSVRG